MRSKLAAAAFACALLPAAAPAAGTAMLTVTIQNVSDKGGDLRVGVYDRVTFLERGSKPVAGRVVPAVPGTISLTFNGLKPGEYGVKALQDLNRNGKMDVLVATMKPVEPFGLSNDAKPTLRGASWDAAKLVLHAGANAATITLH